MTVARPRNRSLGLALGVLAGLATGAGGALAQEACDFVDPGNDLLNSRPPFTYVTNPHLLCEGGVEVWGDSAVVNSDAEMFLLLGSARYADGMRELSATEIRYFYNVGRVQGRGAVRVSNSEDGSVVENGDLVILRETEFRDVEETTFTTGADGVRPRATVYPKRAESPDSLADSVAAPDTTTLEPPPDEAQPEEPQPEEPEPEEPEPEEPEAYVVVADRLFFLGSSSFNATGSVEIQRDSMLAYADSADYQGDRGELVLDGSARVVGSSYDLVGQTITLASRADGTDEVRAVVNAVLTGEDVDVTAPRIVLYLAEGGLERMVAVPLPAPAEGAATASPSDSAAARPVAVSQDIELRGDSLDLAAPAGVLERIFAAGNARSVSSGRQEMNVGTLPELARVDWIDGDTIEVTLVPSDTTTSEEGNAYQVDRIVARVGAHSLYRLAPSDSTAVTGVDPPAVSYMVADQITIVMVDGQADRVESIGQVSGWHLEPVIRPPAEPEDPAAPADSIPAAANAAGNAGGDGAPPGA